MADNELSKDEIDRLLDRAAERAREAAEREQGQERSGSGNSTIGSEPGDQPSVLAFQDAGSVVPPVAPSDESTRRSTGVVTGSSLRSGSNSVESEADVIDFGIVPDSEQAPRSARVGQRRTVPSKRVEPLPQSEVDALLAAVSGDEPVSDEMPNTHSEPIIRGGVDDSFDRITQPTDSEPGRVLRQEDLDDFLRAASGGQDQEEPRRMPSRQNRLRVRARPRQGRARRAAGAVAAGLAYVVRAGYQAVSPAFRDFGRGVSDDNHRMGCGGKLVTVGLILATIYGLSYMIRAKPKKTYTKPRQVQVEETYKAKLEQKPQAKLEEKVIVYQPIEVPKLKPRGRAAEAEKALRRYEREQIIKKKKEREATEKAAKAAKVVKAKKSAPKPVVNELPDIIKYELGQKMGLDVKDPKGKDIIYEEIKLGELDKGAYQAVAFLKDGKFVEVKINEDELKKRYGGLKTK